MIDSHCHLDQEPLINQISDVIERSKKVGVKKILTISTTLDSFNKILNIIKLDPIIITMVPGLLFIKLCLIHVDQRIFDLSYNDKIKFKEIQRNSQKFIGIHREVRNV